MESWTGIARMNFLQKFVCNEECQEIGRVAFELLLWRFAQRISDAVIHIDCWTWWS